MVNISQGEYELLQALYQACLRLHRATTEDEEKMALAHIDAYTLACSALIDGPDDCTSRGGSVEESPSYRASLRDAGRGHLVK